jgi:hypothetical protein
MGADQIAAMRPMIVEMLEGSRGEDVWCAIFEMSGDPARFVQVLPNALNLAYPLVAPPAHVLSGNEVLAKLEVREWKAHEYLTLELPEGASAMDIARLADALFHVVFGCSDDYRIDVSITRLA